MNKNVRAIVFLSRLYQTCVTTSHMKGTGMIRTEKRHGNVQMGAAHACRRFLMNAFRK